MDTRRARLCYRIHHSERVFIYGILRRGRELDEETQNLIHHKGITDVITIDILDQEELMETLKPEESGSYELAKSTSPRTPKIGDQVYFTEDRIIRPAMIISVVEKNVVNLLVFYDSGTQGWPSVEKTQAEPGTAAAETCWSWPPAPV